MRGGGTVQRPVVRTDGVSRITLVGGVAWITLLRTSLTVTLRTQPVDSGARSVPRRGEQLIAGGRTADVLVRADGLLVKRSRSGRSLEAEAALLHHLRQHGVPVPRVVQADGPELVMEHVIGPTVAEELEARPWRAAALGRLMARVHRMLDQVPAPPDLPRFGVGGDGLLHLDLHPNNVLLGPEGPVVIDWVDARRGDRAVDVAYSWLIVASARLRSRYRLMRWAMLRAFLSGYDRDRLRAALPQAVRYRLSGSALEPDERAAVRRVARRVLGRRSGGRGTDPDDVVG